LSFSLDPHLDVERLRQAYARDRRVRIAPFLAGDGAARLQAHLAEREDWRLVLNAGEKVYEMDRAGQAALSDAQRAELDRKVTAAAARHFQFRFESIRVSDDAVERRNRASLLDHFALFMSSAEVVDVLRRITGAADVTFLDAQATRFGAGHFLTAHDDDVEGKNRRVAYVLGLTGEWRPDWGGLLLFHDPEGDIDRGLAPRFNALSIFGLPMQHSVSYVTPSAPHPRVSITGWLRTGLDGASPASADPASR
jgi:SM-20-related protein